MTPRAARRLLVASVLALALAACGSKINEENFVRIQDGMTEQQVIDLLGTPTETSGVGALGMSGASAVWQDGDARISVQFVNGKVRLKQFERLKPR
ncbi:MAG: outer membrane protein assembly factor BamE [Burkholderiales bacterium]|nr:outer membrane protein assembly factor BamE [Burkholderiales bacterium]